MIPPFVILRCVLPYPFVHSDKRLRSLWKKDACGDNTPNHKSSIRPLGSDYTRCYAENASPTTPFCRRKMKKPPISRRPALQSRQALDAVPIAYVDTRHRCRAIDASRRPTMEEPVSPHCVESKLLSFFKLPRYRRRQAAHHGKTCIASLRRIEAIELRFDVSGPKVYGLPYQHAPRG